MDAYKRWLAKGYHGSMDYLDRQAPLKAHPECLLPGVQSVVAVGLNYYRPRVETPGQPKIARYALGRDYHKVMRAKLKRLAAWIHAHEPGSESRPCVDSAPIFERDYARLSGLGWFGKNTMLIDSRRGSWFFIGLLLTTLRLPSSAPAVGGCGTCSRCVEACPTGAIVFEDERWQIDSRRCISYLTIEHRGAIADDLESRLEGWTFGCDVCQEVCPFNAARDSSPMRSQLTSEPDFLADRPWPSLRELADLSREQWDELTRGSAVRRAGLEGLRCNARLNVRSA
jgi:epoxyqueuosine reductase